MSGKLARTEKNKWFLCYFSYVNEAISNCINLSNYVPICNAGVLQNSEVSGINLVRAPELRQSKINSRWVAGPIGHMNRRPRV